MVWVSTSCGGEAMPGRPLLPGAQFALGNGRFATRAAAPERRAGGPHYPGTYAAGVFGRLADEVDEHRIEIESQRHAALPVRVYGEGYRLDPSGSLEVPLQRRQASTATAP